MIRNYFLLNLLLILIIGVLGVKFYNVLKYSPVIPAEAATGERKEEINVEHKDKTLDESAFEAISSLDLFRPSRSASLSRDKIAEKPPLPPPPKLFGTVILNNNKTAILQQSDTKMTKVYRINDSVSGYTVLEIHEDKVVLVGNDEKVEVRLRDDKGIQPQRGAVVRPTVTPPSGSQPGNTGTAVQRRARAVPPRRRPTITTPPANIAPPEVPQPPQTPEAPEAPDTGDETGQEEDQ